MKKQSVKFSNVEKYIITLRDEKVILDSDVATLYGVETKRINEAVTNNPKKFPEGYIIELNNADKQDVVENFDRFDLLKHSTVLPKAFTEKGLYMLATILKSPAAIQITIAIIETFSKIRELSRTIAALTESPEEFKQKSLMQRGGEIIADILSEDMKVTDTETSIELNLALLKVKHTIKQKSKK